eukprot:m.292414 g.292414  ORF g.292414 m.292414 type:complete len:79 (-) comp20000_c0_seq4:1558-1794(-)
MYSARYTARPNSPDTLSRSDGTRRGFRASHRCSLTHNATALWSDHGRTRQDPCFSPPDHMDMRVFQHSNGVCTVLRQM